MHRRAFFGAASVLPHIRGRLQRLKHGDRDQLLADSPAKHPTYGRRKVVDAPAAEAAMDQVGLKRLERERAKIPRRHPAIFLAKEFGRATDLIDRVGRSSIFLIVRRGEPSIGDGKLDDGDVRQFGGRDGRATRSDPLANKAIVFHLAGFASPRTQVEVLAVEGYDRLSRRALESVFGRRSGKSWHVQRPFQRAKTVFTVLRFGKGPALPTNGR